MRLRGDTVTTEELRSFRTLYLQGDSCAAIGRRHKRSASVVHRALSRMCIPMRPPGPKPKRSR